MKSIKDEFLRLGFVVAKSNLIRARVADIKATFESTYQSRWDNCYASNRNLIKRFADSIELASLFACSDLVEMVRALGMVAPVYCGPVVSHYTHRDLTGNSYGLPWHQDYPSMASSSNALIAWISVNDCNPSTHSIQVAPGHHAQGLLAGEQRDNGYVLVEQEFEQSRVLDIKAGDVLLFSPYLPHRTFVNPASCDYKLSFSRRFDDLECPAWPARQFANAYGVSVDRTLYLKQPQASSSRTHNKDHGNGKD
jgi:hypothetical protein